MKRRDFFKIMGAAALATIGVRTAQARVCERNNAFLDRVYPIDSVYISFSPNNPGTRLGGVWERCANGRCLVGVGTSDRNFLAGETSGHSTHALTTAQMPAHNHGNPTVGQYLGTSSGSGNTFAGNGVVRLASNGGGEAHNNLQPYITVFMWRRVA